MAKTKGATGQVPPALAEAIADKSLAILAGAGISVLAPSYLPSWSDFTVALLDEAKSVAGAATFADDRCRKAMAGLTKQNVSVSTLSEAVAKYVASVGYFPMLTVLDGTETNANHRAIADLAKAGILRAIVTPNFDTLIERTFRSTNTPLETIADGQRSDRASGACSLLHLHGVATSPLSMIDTVGQKARGLPWQTHEHMRKTLESYHLLVVGFSGADLDFAADYLSFEAMATRGRGITWLTRPGAPPPPRVAQLLDTAGPTSCLLADALPNFWTKVGCTVATADISSPATPELVAERTRAHIRKIYELIGPTEALALCMRILDDMGARQNAKVLYRALADHIIATKSTLTSKDITTVRALSSSEGLANAGEKLVWLGLDVELGKKALAEWRRTLAEAQDSLTHRRHGSLANVQLPYPFEGKFDAAGWRDVDRKTSDELNFLLSIGLGNLAMGQIMKGNRQEASVAQDEAVDHALLATDLRALAGAMHADALIIGSRTDSLSRVLWPLLLAEAMAQVGGNIDAACAASMLRGQLLMRAGEYDKAEQSFARVLAREPLGVKHEVRTTARLALASLAHRRHNLVDALDLWETALSQSGDNPSLAAVIRWDRINAMRNEPSMRDQLLEDCDQLSAQLAVGLDSNVLGMPSVEDVKRTREMILRHRTEFEMPPFVMQPEKISKQIKDEEGQLRQLLINCEYLQDRARSSELLRRLSALLQNENDHPRALELIEAYAAAEEELGGFEGQMRSHWLLSHALYAVADIAGAQKAAGFLRNIEIAGDPVQERRKRDWIAQLDSHPPQMRHPFLLVRELAEGSTALRRPHEEIEQLAKDLLAIQHATVAQIVLCHLAREKKEAHDWIGLTRCYRLLAESAEMIKHYQVAKELREIAKSFESNDAPSGAGGTSRSLTGKWWTALTKRFRI